MSKVEGGGRVDVDDGGGAGDVAEGIVHDSYVKEAVIVRVAWGLCEVRGVCCFCRL